MMDAIKTTIYSVLVITASIYLALIFVSLTEPSISAWFCEVRE